MHRCISDNAIRDLPVEIAVMKAVAIDHYGHAIEDASPKRNAIVSLRIFIDTLDAV